MFPPLFRWTPFSRCCTKHRGVWTSAWEGSFGQALLVILFLGGQAPSGLDPVLPPQECSARCRCLHWRCPWEDQPAPTTFLYPEEGGVHQEGGVKPCLLPGPTSELYQTLILCRSGAHTNSTHAVCLDTLVSTATTFCMHFCYLYVMSPGYNL